MKTVVPRSVLIVKKNAGNICMDHFGCWSVWCNIQLSGSVHLHQASLQESVPPTFDDSGSLRLTGKESFSSFSQIDEYWRNGCKDFASYQIHDCVLLLQ